MVGLGLVAERDICNVMLIRYACYITAPKGCCVFLRNTIFERRSIYPLGEFSYLNYPHTPQRGQEISALHLPHYSG